MQTEKIEKNRPVFREIKESKDDQVVPPSKSQLRDKELEIELMRWADDGGRNND
jgi:hypothetical protein